MNMHTWKLPAMSHPNQVLDTLLALNTNKRKEFGAFWVVVASLGKVTGKLCLVKTCCAGFFNIFFLAFLLLLQSTGSRCMRFGSCSTWAWQLQLKGSVFVEHGLRSSAAYGIFPDQGSNLCPLQLARQILIHCTTRKIRLFQFKYDLGFPYGLAGKECACNVGDLGSIPGLGRFP